MGISRTRPFVSRQGHSEGHPSSRSPHGIIWILYCDCCTVRLISPPSLGICMTSQLLIWRPLSHMQLLPSECVLLGIRPKTDTSEADGINAEEATFMSTELYELYFHKRKSLGSRSPWCRMSQKMLHSNNTIQPTFLLDKSWNSWDKLLNPNTSLWSKFHQHPFLKWEK